MDDMQRQLEEAKLRGVFEGQVLQSLVDIKLKLDEINGGQYSQDIKINSKAEKSDVSDLKITVDKLNTKVYIFVGGVAVIAFLAPIILKKIL